MTDRPNSEASEQDRETAAPPEGNPAPEPAAPETAGPEAASPEQERNAAQGPAVPEYASPEPVSMAVPVEPVRDEPTPPLPTATAGPAPEPEPSQPRETVEAEPQTSVEPVADTATSASSTFVQPVAPAQVAPESGRPPIPMEPEPSVPDPVSPEPGAPVALAAETDETLALPPTTKEVEPAPVPSAPPPPTGVPVPFATPPTGHSRYFGLKLGLGITGSAVAVIGIVVALVMAIVVFGNSIADKVEATAEEFIGAVAEDDWDTAYAMLCDSYRQRPVEDYTGEWDSWDAEGAEVQPMNAATGNVVVEFDDGSAVELVIAVDETAETLTTSVCGWRSVTI